MEFLWLAEFDNAILLHGVPCASPNFVLDNRISAGGRRLLRLVIAVHRKTFMVVDKDIDIRDSGQLEWAFCIQVNAAAVGRSAFAPDSLILVRQ